MVRIFLLILTVMTIISCKSDTTYTLETDSGKIAIRIFKSSPKHQENFSKLVSEGYYDGLLFHRVIKGFMIQGGDPDSKNASPGQPLGAGGPGYTIPAEIATAQREKYKKLGGSPMLDGDYTVFGEVVNGLDIVDKIASLDTDHQDRPLKDVKMKIYK